MRTSETIKEIALALNKMQSELDTVTKEAKGYNYKYADYASIWLAIREPLTKNGLSVVQDAHDSQNGVSVTTRIIHTSGEWIEFGELTIPMKQRDAHNTGSAVTYGRRYALCAALGIVPDDDDGQQAQKAGAVTIKPVKFDEWVTWAKKEFPDMDDELFEFLSRRADYRKHSMDETVVELGQDNAKFKRDFVAWLAKQEKESGN